MCPVMNVCPLSTVPQAATKETYKPFFFTGMSLGSIFPSYFV